MLYINFTLEQKTEYETSQFSYDLFQHYDIGKTTAASEISESSKKLTTVPAPIKNALE